MGTHFELATGAQGRIVSLGLEGVAEKNITVRKLPVARGRGSRGELAEDEKPAIIISTMGTVGDRGGTNVRDDVDYPILISILASDNQDLEKNHDRYLTWARRIRGRLHNQRVVDSLAESMADNFNCIVRAGPTTVPTAFWSGIWHSSLLLRCYVRETRGAV